MIKNHSERPSEDQHFGIVGSSWFQEDGDDCFGYHSAFLCSLLNRHAHLTGSLMNSHFARPKFGCTHRPFSKLTFPASCADIFSVKITAKCCNRLESDTTSESSDRKLHGDPCSRCWVEMNTEYRVFNFTLLDI